LSDAKPAASTQLAPEAQAVSPVNGQLQGRAIGTAAASSSAPDGEVPVTTGSPSASSAQSENSPLLGDAQPTFRHYGFAVMSVAVAWGLTFAAPALHQLPTSLFFAAVMVTAFHGHLGPGLLATALSSFVLEYFFMSPFKNPETGLEETVRITVFALTAVLINSLHERRRLAEAQRRRLQEQLRQAQKLEAIGRLAGGVAHDFNNFLTVIQGRAQLILRSLEPSDKSRSDIELIDITAGHASEIVRQLLAFGRNQVLEPRILDLDVLVADMERILAPLIGEDIMLVIVQGAALGRIKADPTQLKQVFMNLAANARDAMPQGGRLTIETANVEVDSAFAREHPGASVGPHVRLTVRDTGAGMDAGTMTRVFDPFFTTKDVGKGTGLGLATVYGIIKQHGGYISLESAVGRGTTFAIYLPRVDEREASAAGL
jgi:signal transduction histidine kinase